MIIKPREIVMEAQKKPPSIFSSKLEDFSDVTAKEHQENHGEQNIVL